MTEALLPPDALIRRVRLNTRSICSFGRFLTLISNTILRLCPKGMEINKNSRLSVALDAIFRPSDGAATASQRGVDPRSAMDIVDVAVSVRVLSIDAGCT